MSLTKCGRLSNCIINSNCSLVSWDFKNVSQAYKKLIIIASHLPRTTLLEQTTDYWHGVCRSFVFRFPDDLEILKIPSKGIIQVRSASRIGLSDLGVNNRRINHLYRCLIK